MQNVLKNGKILQIEQIIQRRGGEDGGKKKSSSNGSKAKTRKDTRSRSPIVIAKTWRTQDNELFMN